MLPIVTKVTTEDLFLIKERRTNHPVSGLPGPQLPIGFMTAVPFPNNFGNTGHFQYSSNVFYVIIQFIAC